MVLKKRKLNGRLIALIANLKKKMKNKNKKKMMQSVNFV